MSAAGRGWEMTWRHKFDVLRRRRVRSLRDMIVDLRRAADRLEQMRRAGVTLGAVNETDDYYILETFDRAVARRFSFARKVDES